MTAEAYAALPKTQVLRELRYKVTRKGFRTRSVTLVTTLLDSEKYSAESLAEQYFDRWQIEVDFRHLKQTMKMDVLRCQTTEGVLKELVMFVLIYNLVRQVIVRAAQRQQLPVERISFIDALRWLRDAQDWDELIELLVNPCRPGRVEPRVVKRRPKPYRLMSRPRSELRNILIAQQVTA